MPGRNLRVSVLILSLSLLGLPGGTPAASALAAPDAPGLAIPPAERVVLRSADAVAGPAVVRAIEADAQGARLEFVLPELLVQRLELDGRAFDILEIEGGGVAGREGEPMLPTFTRLIAIPDRAGVTCEVTAIETIELFGYRPFPMQPPEADRLAYDAQAYERAGYPPTNPVRLGEPAIARDLRVVALSFSPVRYDPTRDALEVATRIEVRVRFAGEDLRNAKMHRSRAAAPSFARLYRSLVPNHAGYGEMHAGGGSAAGRGGFGEGSRDEGAASLGSYVLICPNSAEVVAALQPLVQWRTRKGFDVRLATTAETGTSNNQIKAWLQTAYNTWEHPPEFITLVGDANGPVAIPSWGNSDHSYVQLEGGDLLADAHIGRISVESVDQLRLYVAKMVGYESTPYLVDPSWYPRACLVGDPGGCGTPCVQVMQWLKVRLREYGYAQIDTVFSSPFVGPMTTALNRGVTAFAYRGYIGMSGFSTGNIYALTNGWKMPYAVNVTCETGSFESTTSISEAWIRAGVPPNTPTGGIASVGTATAGTHSRYNNCVSYGIWRGIFYEDLFTFGESLTRGKYELWVDYGLWDGAADTWTRLNNLMGDAAGEMWTSVPRALAIGHPATLAVGTNSVSVTVTDQGAPCPGAHVCLWKGLETHAGGVTGADGTAELIVDARTSGEMLITVTAHDAQPYLAAIPVAQAGRFAAHAGHTIDDDASGTSAGNGDGAVNPTERIELPVQVRNYGSETLSGVTGTLTCADPYVTLADDEEIFGEILAGASAWSGDDFDILIAGGAPDGHVVRLGLDIRAGADAWHSAIELPVTAAAFAYDHVTLYGMGTQVEPGEAGEISVALRNVGGAAGSSVTGTLRSESPWLLVTDGAGGFGSIGVGATGENTGNRFAISAAQGAYPGHLAALSIALQFSGGARDTVAFVLRIGTAAADDPTGPDEYGYYAFDNTDTGYLDAPVYTWVEIAANHGGPGADVGLSDFGNNNDAVRVVDLPFPFQFYGQTFTRATICSNGWICMGATYVAHQLNWYIPAACAPDHLIAAMWDDLYQSGQDRVYHWFDANRHRYIVQWSRVLTAEGNAPQNFEIILHDPVHHPTPSGDGEIIFQYDTFNNTDHIQQYSTIGIENGDQTDGLLYGYYNTYNAGAATIASGRAIKFTPLNASPRGILTGTVGNATNGGTPVAGVAVTLSPHDLILTTGDDGVYRATVPVGIYRLIASHWSFAADTLSNVWVVEGQTTDVDFALDDIQPPLFTGTTQLPHTADEQGPYAVSSTVTEFSDFASLTLFYNVRGTGWVDTALNDQGGGVHGAEIPGQMQGSLIKYYLAGEDVGGNAATDPPNAPWEAYDFWVLAPILADDIEAGAGEWQHYALADTLIDQWHVSALRNHTEGGMWSWKFGAADTSDYANLCDGGLESPPLALDGETSFSFWHWMEAEVSQAHQGYAYDGGLVEISLDGGPWTQVAPVGGYPYRVRPGSIPGPFPAETPIFSGTHDWEETHFELGEVSGVLRIRLRFGSDGAVTREGWYVDDVRVVAAAPGLAGTDTGEALPAFLALHALRPNPFGARSARAQIAFDLPRSAAVRLGVFDLGGRRVERLIAATLPAGRHEIAWDGRDARGHALDSGVYFCVLEANGQRLTRRVLLVR